MEHEPYYKKQVVSFDKGDKLIFYRKKLPLFIGYLSFNFIFVTGAFYATGVTSFIIFLLYLPVLFITFGIGSTLFLGITSDHKIVLIVELIAKEKEISEVNSYYFLIKDHKLAVKEHEYMKFRVGSLIEIHYPNESEIEGYFLIKQHTIIENLTPQTFS